MKEVWIVTKGHVDYKEELEIIDVCISKQLAKEKCKKSIEQSFPEVKAFPEKYEVKKYNDLSYNIQNKITGKYGTTFWQIRCHSVSYE
jgi:hypothetical protein